MAGWPFFKLLQWLTGVSGHQTSNEKIDKQTTKNAISYILKTTYYVGLAAQWVLWLIEIKVPSCLNGSAGWAEGDEGPYLETCLRATGNKYVNYCNN